MKKLLIAGNCIFFCCAAVLAMLLYKAETRQPAKAAEAIQTVQPALLTPAVTPLQTPPMPTPDPWALEESYYQPFGELPLPVLRRHAEREHDRPQHSLREENPIDDVFELYWLRPKSTMEDNFLASNYRECWEAEALHALDLLAGTENPAAEYPVRIPEELRDMLHEFSFMTGELYANTFRDGGMAYSGALTTASAACLRSYTFFLYDLLAYMKVQPNFVFDAKDVQEEWDYLLQGYYGQGDKFQLIKTIPAQGNIPAMQINVSGGMSVKDYHKSYRADMLTITRQETGEKIQDIPLEDEHARTKHAPLPLLGNSELDLKVVDANFDGFLDIQLIRNFGGAYNEFYRFFLWDTEQNTFRIGTELDKLYLCDPTFEAKTRTVTAREKDGPFYDERIFHYVNGMPVLVEQTTEEYDYVFERRRDLIQRPVEGELMLMEVCYSPEFPAELPETEGYHMSNILSSFGILKAIPAKAGMPSMAMLICGSRDEEAGYNVLTLEILDMKKRTVRQVFAIPAIEHLRISGLRLNGPEALNQDILCKDLNGDGFTDFTFTCGPGETPIRWLWDEKTERFQLEGEV